jgi:hypothetical protein
VASAPSPRSELALTAVQERAVEDLRRDGVAIVSFPDLFDDASFWTELAGDIGGFVAETEGALPSMSRDDRVAAFGKAFLVRRFRARKDAKGPKRVTVSPGDPWVRLGTSGEMIGIVTTYRESMMRLHDFDNWYTVPDPDVPDRVASQRWHRDGWEDHIVKVFTYFSDVDGEAGPFEYVRGSAAGGKYGSLWPWQDKEVYPPQDELAAAIDRRDCVSLTGVAGTIVFCDTSGFHRGGFARTKPRVLSYHTYLSDEGQRRHRRKFDVDWSGDGAGLPPESRYALD